MPNGNQPVDNTFERYWDTRAGTAAMFDNSFNKATATARIMEMKSKLEEDDKLKNYIVSELDRRYKRDAGPTGLTGTVLMTMFLEGPLRTNVIKNHAMIKTYLDNSKNEKNNFVRNELERHLENDLADSFWEPPRSEEDSDNIIWGSYFGFCKVLEQIIFGVSNGIIFDKIPKRMDPVLLVIISDVKTEKGLCVVKHRDDAPIRYLEGTVALVYTFIEKISYNDVRLKSHNSEEIVVLKKEIYETTNLQIDDRFIIFQLPSVEPAGNPLVVVHTRTTNKIPSKCEEYVNTHSEIYKLEKFGSGYIGSVSLRTLWDNFKNGDFKFHHGSAFVLAILCFEHNITDKAEIISAFENNGMKDYFNMACEASDRRFETCESLSVCANQSLNR